MYKALLRKIDDSVALMAKAEKVALAMQPEDGFYLGFSGGKDSVVLLELAKMAGVKFKAVHNVTGIDAPVTMHFIRDHFPMVELQHPRENYLKLVEKKGLPRMNMRFCCERLKERIGAGYTVLTGVRHDESARRAQYAQVEIYSRRKEHEGKSRERSLEQIEQNQHQCIKGKDRLMVYPILEWNAQDVWDFTHDKGLPVNPVYERLGRCGCMFCPFASTRQIEEYEREYPLYYARVLKAVERWWEKTNEHLLPNPQVYYDWWKSKKTLKAFMAELR